MEELSGLPESIRKLALDRYRLLQPHLEEKQPLRPIAIEAGIPYRTAQRWMTRFQHFGLAALLRKKLTDAGVRRAVPIKIKAAIEGLALQKLHRSSRRIEKVLVVADADDRNPEQLESELKRRLVDSRRLKVIPIIVVQGLEAWLLADPQALIAVGNSRDFKNPEQIRNPKTELQSVAGITRYTPQVAGRIAEEIDLKLLEQRCPRFSFFRKAALAPSSKRGK